MTKSNGSRTRGAARKRSRSRISREPSSWPGSTRLSTPSSELLIKIVPAWVSRQDELDFPGARPVLQVVLALDSAADAIVALGPDKTLQAVLFREAIGHALAVLPYTAREIAGYPDVKSPVRSVRHDVDLSTLHRSIFSLCPNESNRVDHRVEPAHDDFWSFKAVMAAQKWGPSRFRISAAAL